MDMSTFLFVNFLRRLQLGFGDFEAAIFDRAEKARLIAFVDVYKRQGRGDDDGRERPQRQHEDEDDIQQQAPFPAELFGDGIALEREVRRGDPRAQEIHAARKDEQREHREIPAAAEWNGVVHHFFLP